MTTSKKFNSAATHRTEAELGVLARVMGHETEVFTGRPDAGKTTALGDTTDILVMDASDPNLDVALEARIPLIVQGSVSHGKTKPASQIFPAGSKIKISS